VPERVDSPGAVANQRLVGIELASMRVANASGAFLILVPNV
jgi:hypothetical protein